jgi:ABC-type lipoprotein release transport system permease subunit
VELLDVIVVLAASAAIAVLATIYPSRSASRLTPVEAIRHE